MLKERHQTKAVIKYKQSGDKMVQEITILNNDSTIVGVFRKKEDLEDFCTELGIVFIHERKGRDKDGLPYEEYTLNKEIQHQYISKPPISKDAIQLRGVGGGVLTDMFLLPTDNGYVFQEPSRTADMRLFNEETEPTVVLNFYGKKGLYEIKKEGKLDRIGNLARLGDVWVEIQGVKKENKGYSYKLYGRNEWVMDYHITEFKTKEMIDSN
ncbi:hypothetical protein P9X10_01195 [Bacillus cereus]|nr:hypothetical protein [Bacillus cereus]